MRASLKREGLWRLFAWVRVYSCLRCLGVTLDPALYPALSSSIEVCQVLD